MLKYHKLRDSRPNIQFNYLYRDAGNYKLYGFEIFRNPERVQPEIICKKIKAALIDGESFEPEKWNLKRLGFEEWSDELDHGWNEFGSVEPTAQGPTSGKSITEFLNEISQS